MSDDYADRGWRELAACGGQDPDMWFSHYAGPPGPVTKRALSICHRCPVEQECLDEAIETRQDHGVWGGMLPGDRRREGQRRLECR